MPEGRNFSYRPFFPNYILNLEYVERFSSYRVVNSLHLLMLRREIIAVCFEIPTKTHKYTVWAECKPYSWPYIYIYIYIYIMKDSVRTAQ